MSKQTYPTSILITGGTQGLGYQTALSLARQCPQTLIVVASRTDPASAATSINSKLKQSNVTYLPLDLGTLASTRSFADAWLAANHPPLQALVLNAGIQLPGGIEYTPDGIEKHFAINHVSHALLFHLLLPCLTPTARIVVVASGVHDPVLAKKFGFYPAYTTAAEVATPDAAAVKASGGRDRYSTSKAANVIWTYAVGRHMSQVEAHKGKTVVSFNPGLMFGTNFARDAHPLLKFLNAYIAPRLTRFVRLFMDGVRTPVESGGDMAWLVLSKEMEGKKGPYCEKRGVIESSEQSKKEELQEDLYRWTAERVAMNKEEEGRFLQL